MVYYTNRQIFQHGFIFGFCYMSAVGLGISTTVLACHVYDTVKMHMNLSGFKILRIRHFLLFSTEKTSIYM